MLTLATLLACSPKAPTEPAPAAPPPEPDEASVAAAGVRSPALRVLLTEQWDATMERYPEWATELGDHRFDDRLTDRSDAAVQRWLQRQQEWTLRLATLHDDMLAPGDRVTRDLLLGDLRAQLAASVCREHQWNVSARGNALVDANTLAEGAVVVTPQDAAALVARYRALPQAIDDDAENLRLGLAARRVGVADSLTKVVEMLDRELASPVADAPMLLPALAEHPDWSDDERASFRTDLEQAITEGIRPALDRYRAVVRDEVLPEARTGDHIGVSALPDGEACYDALILQQTTLTRTPDALHQTGLDELARIHEEMRALGRTLFDTDDLAAIFEELRTDPALHFDTAEAVHATAEDALRRAEAAVPDWFGRVPRSPCVVEDIPAYLAPYTTVAYYQPVRPDGSKPGIYYVNVYDPTSRPRTEAEVLAFHESVPGHHLQIALAQEAGALPAFRRYDGATAFVEGWGLYAERLADEMGLYTGDLDRMGMLAFDSWRASRLVVDTGLHAKGWTREQAVQFMLENTPLAENNVVNEVDRYVTTPAQALAYKTGQLEIRALRAEAEEALGGAFDVKAFHDVVLGGGAVSLPVLRQQVETWIAREGGG
ncbi:MAG: DUF885 domain-containing protein [Myxococcota bacterium]